MSRLPVLFFPLGSFADRPGFRCGTGREYPLVDVVECGPLSPQERPLIVMECSVIAERYLGLGYTPEALDLMLTLKRRALRHGGDFTLRGIIRISICFFYSPVAAVGEA